MAKHHDPEFFEGIFRVDERPVAIPPVDSLLPIVADKIAINHYRCKSKEEFLNKLIRYHNQPVTGYMIGVDIFEQFDHNDEFDDGILRYRAERAKTFRPPDLAHAYERMFNALTANLSPTLVPTTPPQFYAGKMETFLTCRAVADYLKTRLIDAAPAKFYEEAALKAIMRTLASGGMTLADARLLLSELPNLLILPYPVVDELRKACIQIIPQIMQPFHRYNLWSEISELDYLQRLLQTWK